MTRCASTSRPSRPGRRDPSPRSPSIVRRVRSSASRTSIVPSKLLAIRPPTRSATKMGCRNRSRVPTSSVAPWSTSSRCHEGKERMSMRAMRMQVMVVAILAGLGVAPQARAYFAGGGKDAAKGNDCLIGYEVDASDVTPDGNKNVVTCTDCDPACDLDGVDQPNNSCTFEVGVCTNQSGVDGCTPASGLSKAKAKVKGAKVVIDVSQLLEGSACSALLDLPVELKKNGKKAGKAKFSLSAQVKKDPDAGVPKTRKDKDTLTYVCEPLPEGASCPSASTTTTTVTSTTSTTVNLCGNEVIDPSEECDDGNG